MRLSRRGLLIGGAAGGGLLIAWALMPRRYDAPLPTEPGETAFGAWLTIGRDGVAAWDAVPAAVTPRRAATPMPSNAALRVRSGLASTRTRGPSRGTRTTS